MDSTLKDKEYALHSCSWEGKVSSSLVVSLYNFSRRRRPHGDVAGLESAVAYGAGAICGPGEGMGTGGRGRGEGKGEGEES